jgi:triacylglycerol lipase
VRRTLLAAAVAAVAALTPAAAAWAVEPILFVHGWNNSGVVWNTMIGRFRADGWTAAQTNNWSYASAQSNAITAAQVAREVDQIRAATGASKVDLITHSMGALPTRYYLKSLGGAAKIDDWVSLGGSNHGTTTADYCFWTVSCREMRLGSTFLAALNAGDETPGAVHYGTWRSPCDQVVDPDSTVPLSGATNFLTACMPHGSLHQATSIYHQVRDFVD